MFQKHIYRFLPLITFALIPASALAQPANFKELAGVVLDIVDLLVLLLISLCFVVVMWGVIKAWILEAGNDQSVAKGRQIALAGVIGLVVIVAIWGIVKLISLSVFPPTAF